MFEPNKNTLLNIRTDTVNDNHRETSSGSLFSPSFFKTKNQNSDLASLRLNEHETCESDENIDNLQDLLNVMRLELGQTRVEIETQRTGGNRMMMTRSQSQNFQADNFRQYPNIHQRNSFGQNGHSQQVSDFSQNSSFKQNCQTAKNSQNSRNSRNSQNQDRPGPRSYSPSSSNNSNSFSNNQATSPPNNYLCHNCFVPGHYRVGLTKGYNCRVE